MLQGSNALLTDGYEARLNGRAYCGRREQSGGNLPLQFVAPPACCVFRVRTITEVISRWLRA